MFLKWINDFICIHYWQIQKHCKLNWMSKSLKCWSEKLPVSYTCHKNNFFLAISQLKADVSHMQSQPLSVRLDEPAFSIYHSWICASSCNVIAISIIELLFWTMQLAIYSSDLSERRKEYTWYRARYCLGWGLNLCPLTYKSSIKVALPIELNYLTISKR